MTPEEMQEEAKSAWSHGAPGKMRVGDWWELAAAVCGFIRDENKKKTTTRTPPGTYNFSGSPR